MFSGLTGANFVTFTIIHLTLFKKKCLSSLENKWQQVSLFKHYYYYYYYYSTPIHIYLKKGFEFRVPYLYANGLEAERISYFCLARNLIRPLGSTHNFTQSRWLILFNPNYLSEQLKLEKPSNTPSFAEHRSGQTSYCLLFNSSSSSSITPPWGKPSNLWTPCVYSPRPRVPSGIWIR